jgi:hypothetical protein
MFFPSISLLVRMLLENKSDILTKPKTKSETSTSTLQVQFKEIPNEDVGQEEHTYSQVNI